MEQKIDKITKKLNFVPVLTRLKLEFLKFFADTALTVASKRRKKYNCNTVMDVPYDKPEANTLQRFDYFYPKMEKESYPCIFFIHGGAWSMGDKSHYTWFCKAIAECGYAVVNVNYRLFPGVTLYDTVEDCMNAIRFALKNSKNFRIDKSNVFFAGDSAGAHICSLIAARATNKELKLDCTIKALGLYYGAYDLEMFESSKMPIIKILHKYFKSALKEDLPVFYKNFSPKNYISKNFPPTFLTAGEVDKLFCQSDAFAKTLTNEGIEFKKLFFKTTIKGASHGFLNFPFSAPGNKALKTMLKFFDTQMIRTTTSKKTTPK